MSADQSYERELTAVVLDLLRDAASAHGDYESEVLGGVYDVHWPEWYARHIAGKLVAGGFRLVGPQR
jgi:hypothetical protein